MKYEQKAAGVMLRQAREGAQLAAKAEKPGCRRASTKNSSSLVTDLREFNNREVHG